MDALEALCNRASVGRLTEPGPTPAQLETLLRAADRAPDHKLLRPWRLILVSGAGAGRRHRARRAPCAGASPTQMRRPWTRRGACRCGPPW